MFMTLRKSYQINKAHHNKMTTAIETTISPNIGEEQMVARAPLTLVVAVGVGEGDEVTIGATVGCELEELEGIMMELVAAPDLWRWTFFANPTVNVVVFPEIVAANCLGKIK